VTASCCPGWADSSSGSFLAGARVFPLRGQGQAGAPGAAQRRGRTSLDAGKRREIPESGEGLVAVGLSGVACWFPVRGWRSDLASTHLAPRRRAGGCHDHVSGDRAAQSGDRARRWRRLMPQGRACPGLGDPRVVTAAAVLPGR
jgi:hypothetical protein